MGNIQHAIGRGQETEIMSHQVLLGQGELELPIRPPQSHVGQQGKSSETISQDNKGPGRNLVGTPT